MNLPWETVIDGAAVVQAALARYNIDSSPTHPLELSYHHDVCRCGRYWPVTSYKGLGWLAMPCCFICFQLVEQNVLSSVNSSWRILLSNL
jgi:hypothetical protein